MNPEAMKPFGLALLDYHRGKQDATLVLCRDDGVENEQRAAEFFRDARGFELEKRAMGLCAGSILDIGAGAGIHSLYLQEQGFTVTSIDVSPEAVQVMRERGVEKAVVADVMSFEGGPFDTVLLMCNGIGMVETLDGLDRFLARVPRLLNPGGQVLLTSVDVRELSDPGDVAYRENNASEGRYIGEIWMKLRYGGLEAPLCGWLRVDPEMLDERASAAGLDCELIQTSADGIYLARLSLS